jgi:Gpi18-like mannosyltransferase
MREVKKKQIQSFPLMATAKILLKKFLANQDFLFPATIWLVSRIFIWSAMLLVAPLLPLPEGGTIPEFGWKVFDAWDAVHYRNIATSGYEYINDGKQHNLAFFPLFPLSIWALMKLGLPFELAGMLVNNLAFLAAIYLLYLWLKEHSSIRVAQWVTVAIAWCPMSMFTAIIYTEGLYLCLSTAALRAFDRKQYQWTALCGAMATATRPTGMALIPAFMIAAWQERKPPVAYLAGLAAATGLLLFSLYSASQFHDPLAFIQAQKGWRPSFGFDWEGWLNMVMEIPLGSNWYYGWVSNDDGSMKDIWHPIIFSVVVVTAYPMWLFRKYLHPFIIYAGYAAVGLIFMLADEQLINNLLNLFMFVGGGYLLWYFRQRLTPVMVAYGFCGLGLLLASGGTISLSRIAYGIVPLTIAVGVWLSRYPRQAYLLLGWFVILMGKLAIGFAQELWVG